MGRVLAVTGAAGKKSGGAFAGLLAANIKTIDGMFDGGIRALVRPSSETESLERQLPGIDIRRGEITDQEYLRASLKDVNTLVHIAGIHWSEGIVRAAAVCSVRRLILIHTTGIYSKYKAAGEGYRMIEDTVYQVCRENGIILTILRPTMIYGNLYDQNVIKFVKMVDKLPLMPVVNHARYELQPVHYMDLAKAYYNVLTHEQETANRDFILSGGRPILLRDMFVEIGKNLGKNVRFINCPFRLAYAGAWCIYVLTIRKIDYREKVQRLCEPRSFSHRDAAEAFGYDPMPFEEGIINEIKEYRAEKSK